MSPRTPRTICSIAAPPLAFLVGCVQAWTAPCFLHSDDGERTKLRLPRDMESCSRDLDEKIRLALRYRLAFDPFQ